MKGRSRVVWVRRLGFVECFSRFSTRGTTPRASLFEAPDAWVEDAYTRVNAVRAGDGDQPALVARAAAPSLARLRPTKEPQAQHIVQQGCGGKKARASQADSGRAELVVSTGARKPSRDVQVSPEGGG